jgi:hypothetical protein
MKQCYSSDEVETMMQNCREPNNVQPEVNYEDVIQPMDEYDVDEREQEVVRPVPESDHLIPVSEEAGMEEVVTVVETTRNTIFGKNSLSIVIWVLAIALAVSVNKGWSRVGWILFACLYPYAYIAIIIFHVLVKAYKD